MRTVFTITIQLPYQCVAVHTYEGSVVGTQDLYIYDDMYRYCVPTTRPAQVYITTQYVYITTQLYSNYAVIVSMGVPYQQRDLRTDQQCIVFM